MSSASNSTPMDELPFILPFNAISQPLTSRDNILGETKGGIADLKMESANIAYRDESDQIVKKAYLIRFDSETHAIENYDFYQQDQMGYMQLLMGSLQEFADDVEVRIYEVYKESTAWNVPKSTFTEKLFGQMKLENGEWVVDTTRPYSIVKVRDTQEILIEASSKSSYSTVSSPSTDSSRSLGSLSSRSSVSLSSKSDWLSNSSYSSDSSLAYRKPNVGTTLLDRFSPFSTYLISIVPKSTVRRMALARFSLYVYPVGYQAFVTAGYSSESSAGYRMPAVPGRVYDWSDRQDYIANVYNNTGWDSNKARDTSNKRAFLTRLFNQAPSGYTDSGIPYLDMKFRLDIDGIFALGVDYFLSMLTNDPFRENNQGAYTVENPAIGDGIKAEYFGTDSTFTNRQNWFGTEQSTIGLKQPGTDVTYDRYNYYDSTVNTTFYSSFSAWMNAHKLQALIKGPKGEEHYFRIFNCPVNAPDRPYHHELRFESRVIPPSFPEVQNNVYVSVGRYVNFSSSTFTNNTSSSRSSNSSSSSYLELPSPSSVSTKSSKSSQTLSSGSSASSKSLSSYQSRSDWSERSHGSKSGSVFDFDPMSDASLSSQTIFSAESEISIIEGQGQEYYYSDSQTVTTYPETGYFDGSSYQYSNYNSFYDNAQEYLTSIEFTNVAFYSNGDGDLSNVYATVIVRTPSYSTNTTIFDGWLHTFNTVTFYDDLQSQYSSGEVIVEFNVWDYTDTYDGFGTPMSEVYLYYTRYYTYVAAGILIEATSVSTSSDSSFSSLSQAAALAVEAKSWSSLSSKSTASSDSTVVQRSTSSTSYTSESSSTPQSDSSLSSNSQSSLSSFWGRFKEIVEGYPVFVDYDVGYFGRDASNRFLSKVFWRCTVSGTYNVNPALNNIGGASYGFAAVYSNKELTTLINSGTTTFSFSATAGQVYYFLVRPISSAYNVGYDMSLRVMHSVYGYNYASSSETSSSSTINKKSSASSASTESTSSSSSSTVGRSSDSTFLGKTSASTSSSSADRIYILHHTETLNGAYLSLIKDLNFYTNHFGEDNNGRNWIYFGFTAGSNLSNRTCYIYPTQGLLPTVSVALEYFGTDYTYTNRVSVTTYNFIQNPIYNYQFLNFVFNTVKDFTYYFRIRPDGPNAQALNSRTLRIGFGSDNAAKLSSSSSTFRWNESSQSSSSSTKLAKSSASTSSSDVTSSVSSGLSWSSVSSASYESMNYNFVALTAKSTTLVEFLNSTDAAVNGTPTAITGGQVSCDAVFPGKNLYRQNAGYGTTQYYDARILAKITMPETAVPYLKADRALMYAEPITQAVGFKLPFTFAGQSAALRLKSGQYEQEILIQDIAISNTEDEKLLPIVMTTPFASTYTFTGNSGVKVEFNITLTKVLMNYNFVAELSTSSSRSVYPASVGADLSRSSNSSSSDSIVSNYGVDSRVLVLSGPYDESRIYFNKYDYYLDEGGKLHYKAVLVLTDNTGDLCGCSKLFVKTDSDVGYSSTELTGSYDFRIRVAELRAPSVYYGYDENNTPAKIVSNSNDRCGRAVMQSDALIYYSTGYYADMINGWVGDLTPIEGMFTPMSAFLAARGLSRVSYTQVREHKAMKYGGSWTQPEDVEGPTYAIVTDPTFREKNSFTIDIVFTGAITDILGDGFYITVKNYA